MSAPVTGLIALSFSVVLCAAGAKASCQIDVVPISFGVVNASDGAASSGRISVWCADASAFQLRLAAGQGSVVDRRMHGPGSGALHYNVYLDPGHQRIWGDGISGGETISATVDAGETMDFDIHGRVFADQAVAPGTYGDTLVIEVVF
ncbi:MAG: spore coat U domain-containing protein [Geminicoccaceae bacterium]